MDSVGNHPMNAALKMAEPSSRIVLLALVPFALLPFTVYAGVAAQGAGLYLFGMIWPAIALRGCWRSANSFSSNSFSSNSFSFQWDRRNWFRVGLAMAGMWMLFPLTQILNELAPMHATVITGGGTLTLKQMMSSQLPSTWGVSALVLCMLGMWPKRQHVKQAPTPSPGVTGMTGMAGMDETKIFSTFVTATAIATTLYGVYFFFQHLTGFDYRLEGFQIPPNQLMTETRYRISGLYGHPLAMAGASLTQFVFFGWLSLSSFPSPSQNYPDKLESNRRTRRLRPHLRAICGYIAGCNFIFLAMSGGRAALVAGVVMALLAAYVMIGRKLTLYVKWLLVVAVIAVASAVVIYLGIYIRFVEIFEIIARGEQHRIERLVFWKVHWQAVLDNPWYGQGAAQLSMWLREAYYDALGFQYFHQKYNAHNIYLETLANIGVTGCLLLAVLLGYCLKKIRAYCFHNRLASIMMTAIVVAVIANMINGVTQNVFFDASVIAVYMSYFWIFFWVVMIGSNGPKHASS